MIIHISEKVILTLGAIACITAGAAGMYGISKVITPAYAVESEAVVSSVSPKKTTKTATTVVLPAKSIANGGSVASLTSSVPEPMPVIEPAAPTPVLVPEKPTPKLVPAARPGFARAEIIKIEPHYIMKTIPYRRCHLEPRTTYVYSGGPSGAGAVLGGVTGGLVGNQFGGGNGKVAATIGGAILGAVAGHQVENDMSRPVPHLIYVRVCETDYMKKSVRSGYEVTYLYKGQKNTLIKKHRPVTDTIEIPIADVSDV